MREALKFTTVLLFIFFTASCNLDDESDLSCIDPDKIDLDAACYEIFDPVCGCNGTTYSNDCFAEVAGVISWTEGACED